MRRADQLDGMAKVIQVIRTELTVRGDGTDDSPVRRIVQFWSLDGELLAEVDPSAWEQNFFLRPNR
jgi:hypothetical protein